MAQGNASDRPRWLGVVQLAAILLVIVIALYFARAPDRVAIDAAPDLTAEKGKPAVSVIKPKPTSQALTVRLTGSVRVEERARVVSEVAGRVVWISPKFSNGGSIPANETFIRIDTAEHELRVERATMAVKAAEARVWVEKAGGEEDAKAFLRANPGAEVSDSVRRLPSIAEMEAELAQAQAVLKLAKLRLKQTKISLPYDSRVLATELEVGEFVGPARSAVPRPARLGTVYRTDAIRVRVPVDPKGPGVPLPGDRPFGPRPDPVGSVRRDGGARVIGRGPEHAPRPVVPQVFGRCPKGGTAAAGHVRGSPDRGAFV